MVGNECLVCLIFILLPLFALAIKLFGRKDDRLDHAAKDDEYHWVKSINFAHMFVLFERP